MKDCLFCKIANKEISANIVFENENIIAFNDVTPQAKIHILVIPKTHFSNILDINNDKNTLFEMFNAIQTIVKKLNLDKTGFRLITNTGKDGKQSIMHLHFHILAGEELPEKIV